MEFLSVRGGGWQCVFGGLGVFGRIIVEKRGRSHYGSAVLLAKNLGAEVRKVPCVFSSGSVLSWEGSSVIKWINGGEPVHQPEPVVIPANTEVEMLIISLKQIDQKTPFSARDSKLIEGNIFNVH